MSTASKKQYYDVKYSEENYFRYRAWLYAPYISSLVAFLHLRPGSRILDVGCGQGLFSCLFHRCGMTVHGIDLSEVGVRTAERTYGGEGITFSVADIDNLERAGVPRDFDCVFVRSCSLYNTAEFAQSWTTTRVLARHLKPGGIFVFAYYTKLGRPSAPAWRYHSLGDVGQHFRACMDRRVFFCNRLDTLVMRRWAFNSIVTRINSALSKAFGIGGDAICIFRLPPE